MHKPIVRKQYPRRSVVYIAPPGEKIEKFARTVCRKLGERHGQDYSDTPTVQGLTSFLKTVINIQVKAKNAGGAHVSQKTG